jgi:hypothetical protein
MPAEISHEVRQTLASSCAASSLGYLQDVEQRLRAHTLDVIVADFSAHAFKAQSPCVSIASVHLLTL